MSVINQQLQNPRAASESVGLFFGELLGKIGYISSLPVSLISNKTEQLSEKSDGLKKVVDWVKKNKTVIAKIFFTVACFLNFYFSPLLFTVGVIAGFLASTTYSLIEFKSLQDGELLGHTSERGFATQKVMTLLAGLNLYIGNTLLDNMFFGISGGLIAGNNLFHMCKDTERYKNAHKYVIDAFTRVKNQEPKEVVASEV